MQRQLHIQGRYGITIFAWSGIEMALWDAVGKVAGEPVYKLLGGAVRERVAVGIDACRFGPGVGFRFVGRSRPREGRGDAEGDREQAGGVGEPLQGAVVAQEEEDELLGPVPGYESWWDVPIAESSEMDSVRKARADYEQAVKKERYFL